jgi:hypothetical protein
MRLPDLSGGPPEWLRSSRLAIFGSVAALLVIIGGFSWIAVKSFEFVHSNLIVSKLKPARIAGPQEIVFDWSREACEPRDIPDEPAHAFRDDRGQVHLIASHYVSRDNTGPSLDRVRHRCPVIMRSAYDRRPSKYAYKEWIFSPYTVDGRNVYALIHDEYHGNEVPGECPSNNLFKCWYNAITLAHSTDRGATFRHARRPPDQLVAEVPYRYVPDSGQVGIFQPSNIVKKGGYYYALVSGPLPRYRLQKGGDCLIRTNRLDDPTSWRAWDGRDFSVTFVDPYRVRADPADHVCEPVSPDEIGSMTSSLTYNSYFGKYLLVGTSVAYDAGKRRLVSGFYYSLSDDLITWRPRKLIKEAVVVQTYKCGDPDPVLYGSALDPESTSRNFETTGRRPFLYFTRIHYKACRQTLDRDLVRVPIEFSK